MNTLTEAIEAYLQLRHDLGFKLTQARCWLRDFAGFMEALPVRLGVPPGPQARMSGLPATLMRFSTKWPLTLGKADCPSCINAAQRPATVTSNLLRCAIS